VTEIQWRTDWKPSELPDGLVHIRGKHGSRPTGVGEIKDHVLWLFGNEDPYDDEASNYFDLGPRISIEDAAEVERLRARLAVYEHPQLHRELAIQVVALLFGGIRGRAPVPAVALIQELRSGGEGRRWLIDAAIHDAENEINYWICAKEVAALSPERQEAGQ
jgi:hypothetical protein